MSRLRRLTERMLQHVLGLSDDEVSFERRGFPAGDPEVRRHLERAGETFVRGYNVALRHRAPAELVSPLAEVERELRGFVHEGAAMGLELLDLLTPWRSGRLSRFLEGPGERHAYMVHVGAGWALARLRRDPGSYLERADPLLGWLAVDGYGFHEGYFRTERYLSDGEGAPFGAGGYAERAFDQGLGRSLWFSRGADPERIGRTVRSLREERSRDLWAGVGLAAAYAGPEDPGRVRALREEAGPAFLPDLALGAAFAAEARERAGNVAPYTETACRRLCGTATEEAAAVTRRGREAIPRDGGGGPGPAYGRWRSRVRRRFEDSAREAAS